MTTFTVDPATLQELSGKLTTIHSNMSNMKAVASGYEGLLGGSDLEGEVGHFCSTWGYGIGKLHDHMGQVVQRLDCATRTYSTSETEIAQAASGGTQGGGGR
ncbi:MAG TPA: hypothetical protein VFN55_16825 [Solirubrobacteraceae bacterium]|nr:hypothetical protein [Solirubrobacteraceae bacterium]